MNNNPQEIAKFGDKFETRNHNCAIYCRCNSGHHYLMVNDPENDFIRCNEDGHIFDRELLGKPIECGKHKGKTPIEVYGWNRE